MDAGKVYKMIGLMSGTSGDGLDMAYCEFRLEQDRWSYVIHEAVTVPFPEKLGSKLKTAHLLGGLDLSLLDVKFGQWMGEQVRAFVAEKKLSVDALASHGHTVFHQPDQGLSLQIGNGWSLHKASGIPVINDFRMLDIQLGGQGAPLVPIGDRLLFGEYDYCINLGGIANVSMEFSGLRLAFDICPFNLLLNHYAGKLGAEYDKDGNFAKKGKLLPEVFEKLNDINYYYLKGSKSLGREDLDPFFDVLEKENHAPEDILHTLVQHYVHQLKNAIKPIPDKCAQLLITGGGAFNSFFVDTLKIALGESFAISAASKELINFKEALIFAFLGVLRLRGENNCLLSVTGASRDNCGGTMYGL